MSKINATPYLPISCDYYDELIFWSMRKTTCTIVYAEENGETQTVNARIKDIYTKEKKEFLLLDNEQTIRLDRLVSVNGRVLTRAC